MSKVCVFLADGFEEVEGLMVVDMLRRARIEVQMVSITGDLRITGRSHIEVTADCLLEDKKNFDEIDMLVLPGGMPGTNYLESCEALRKLLISFNEQKKKIAAICAAPSILGKMGLLQGKKATCYPGMENLLSGAEVEDKKVVVDGNIITSRGLGTSISFSLRLIEQLEGKKTAEDVADDVVFLHKWA